MSKIGYIQRYLLLIRRVRNHPYITFEELRQGVEQELIARGEPIRMLSQRTIERDIRDIRTALGVSIDYSRTERGYFIPHDEESNSDLEHILESFEVLTAMRQDTGVMDFQYLDEVQSPVTIQPFQLPHEEKAVAAVIVVTEVFHLVHTAMAVEVDVAGCFSIFV